jgi:hypothetical protein
VLDQHTVHARAHCYPIAPGRILYSPHISASPGPWQDLFLIETIGYARNSHLILGKLVSRGKALIRAKLGYSAGIGFAVGFLRWIKELVWVMFDVAALTAYRFINERSLGRQPETETPK